MCSMAEIMVICRSSSCVSDGCRITNTHINMRKKRAHPFLKEGASFFRKGRTLSEKSMRPYFLVQFMDHQTGA